MIEEGQTLLTIDHLGTERKHWVAFAINGKTKQLEYGNSQGKQIPERVSAAYSWWILKHAKTPFDVISLPVMKQVDTFSCGILVKVTLESMIMKTNSFDFTAPYDAHTG